MKSSVDGVQRAYEYTYDGASRLNTATYASTKAGENYALNSVSYDKNGNITALNRNGATTANYSSFGNVDNLTYTYQSNSNKVLKVTDATTGNTDLGDFRDNTNTDNDYAYWIDGSLKKDKNKKITLITYNYLKLPAVITFDNTRTITTEYDAAGTKLKKIDSNGEVTDYEEDDIYVNGNLYQSSHQEGRIANGIYEYNITDHLGNLRVSFRDSSGIAVALQSIFYDPWGLTMKGMQVTRNPVNFNKHQFLNRETQFETGYIDLIHRQFDPQAGRFTSQDPVIEGQEHLSLYQYGNNNPLRYTDPDGRMAVECCGETGAAIGGFMSGLGEAVIRNVKALTVNLPETIQGLGSLGNPVGQMQAAIGGAMLYDKTKSDWNTGDTRTRANIVGNIVGEIGIAVAGSKGVGSLGKAGVVADVAKVGEVTEMVNVYRGVNSTSPAFAAAENGVVKSRGGVLGHSDALTHNTGVNGTANSKMTSWTTNPEVAKNFALRTSGNGVVLSQQVPASSLITSPNLKTINLIQGGGRVSESEVLLRGTQRNLNVQKIGQ